MPQMNPSNWLLLMMLFNFIFISSCTKIHFYFLSNSDISSVKSLIVSHLDFKL